MNNAEIVLDKLGFKKTTLASYRTYENSDLSNDELHELLNDECSNFQELLDQDTWSFTDGSYITRNEDDYFFDDNISDFELMVELEEMGRAAFANVSQRFSLESVCTNLLGEMNALGYINSRG